MIYFNSIGFTITKEHEKCLVNKIHKSCGDIYTIINAVFMKMNLSLNLTEGPFEINLSEQQLKKLLLHKLKVNNSQEESLTIMLGFQPTKKVGPLYDSTVKTYKIKGCFYPNEGKIEFSEGVTVYKKNNFTIEPHILKKLQTVNIENFTFSYYALDSIKISPKK